MINKHNTPSKAEQMYYIDLAHYILHEDLFPRLPMALTIEPYYLDSTSFCLKSVRYIQQPDRKWLVRTSIMHRADSMRECQDVARDWLEITHFVEVDNASNNALIEEVDFLCVLRKSVRKMIIFTGYVKDPVKQNLFERAIYQVLKHYKHQNPAKDTRSKRDTTRIHDVVNMRERIKREADIMKSATLHI